METIELDNQKRLGVQDLARWILTWLFVQTMLFGALAWFVSFQVFVRGADISYIPPYEDIAPRKK